MNSILKNLTVGTVIFDETLNKILLIPRNKKDEAFPNTFGLPGGRLEEGEDFIKAAKREVKEEVGLDIDKLHYVGVYADSGFLMTCYASIVNIDTKISDGLWINFNDINRLNLPPNIYEASNIALLELKNLEFRGALKNINSTINKASNFLIANMQNIDGLVGWHHHINQNKIGTIGTSIGAMTLIHSGYLPSDNIVAQCLDTIKRKVNSDGGWSLKSIEHIGSPSITESSCYCLDLFVLSGLSYDNSYVSNAVKWLIDNQLKSGGWGANLFSEEIRILPTALSIISLSSFENCKLHVEKGVKCLLASQNKDGGWGSHRNNEKSTPAHTARAVLALETYSSKYDFPVLKNIKQGIKWMIKSKENSGHWVDASEIDYVNYKDKEAIRIEFKHSSQPLCLLALLKCGHKYFEYIMLEGLFNIVSTQQIEGYWSHVLAPGHIPIWATYDNIKLLSEFKENILENNSDLLKVIDYERQTEKTLNAFLSFVTFEKSQISKISNQGIDEIKKEVRKLVSLNSHELALEIILLMESEKGFINEAIVLSSRLNQLEMQERLLIASPEVINVEKNKLSKSILELIDKI